VILGFDGHAVSGIDDLHRLLGDDRIGVAAPIVVLRRGRRASLTITPAESQRN
jgi:S1-C subfamily serine protease